MNPASNSPNLPSADKGAKSSLIYDTRFKTHYLLPKYWSTWILVLLLFIVSLLPASVQDTLSNKLGDLMRNSNKKRQHIARTNIELCFPELEVIKKEAILKNCFQHYARSMLHYGLIWWGSKAQLKKRIVIVGEENIERSLANNRAIIFMTAHSMGLEAAVSAITMRLPITGPFNPMKNKLIDWFVAKGRARHGTLIYTRDSGLRPIIKDVRAGCAMFYLPDEDLGKERCIFAPFFGQQKASVPVLGRLSKTCKADVLPCISCYDEKTRQYQIHVLPAIKDFPMGDDFEDTVLMNQSLEEIIRICPSQYLWIMKMFKTRPDGDANLY
jgi:lipid A biosynthesis (KDO)2-(lauroyl)-lipid IVA acyltransferase